MLLGPSWSLWKDFYLQCHENNWVLKRCFACCSACVVHTSSMAFKNNSSLDISKLCWQAKWQNGDTRLLHVGFASYVLWINHQHAAALPLCWPNYWQEWGSLKGTWLWWQILKPLWFRWYSDINKVFGGSYCCHFLHACFVMGIYWQWSKLLVYENIFMKTWCMQHVVWLICAPCM